MIFNPTLKRKGIEVAAIHEALRTINFVVHVHTDVETVKTLEYKAHITSRVKEMVKYLEMEGFIAPSQTWITNMGVIIHPPQDGDGQYEPQFS